MPRLAFRAEGGDSSSANPLRALLVARLAPSRSAHPGARHMVPERLRGPRRSLGAPPTVLGRFFRAPRVAPREGRVARQLTPRVTCAKACFACVPVRRRSVAARRGCTIQAPAALCVMSAQPDECAAYLGFPSHMAGPNIALQCYIPLFLFVHLALSYFCECSSSALPFKISQLHLFIDSYYCCRSAFRLTRLVGIRGADNIQSEIREKLK